MSPQDRPAPGGRQPSASLRDGGKLFAGAVAPCRIGAAMCAPVGPVARLILVVATCASACAATREPWLVSVPQPGVQPVSRLDAIFDYRIAAATVASIFERDLGLTPFPVTFQFFPHRDAFEKALLESGYDAALARSTARTMMAVGGFRGVLLNETALGSLPWAGRLELLAHEMGHSLQYELGGGRRGTSDQWLREGFADWLSVQVLERLDAGSVTAVRRERLRELRAAGRSNTPRIADLVTFRQWVNASERHGASAYALSFLGVDFLLERHGVQTVLGYFKRFASSEDRSGNFRSAFGEDLHSFEAALAAKLWR